METSTDKAKKKKKIKTKKKGTTSTKHNKGEDDLGALRKLRSRRENANKRKGTNTTADDCVDDVVAPAVSVTKKKRQKKKAKLKIDVQSQDVALDDVLDDVSTREYDGNAGTADDSGSKFSENESDDDSGSKFSDNESDEDASVPIVVEDSLQQKSQPKNECKNPDGNNGLNSWKNKASINLWQSSKYLLNLKHEDRSPIKHVFTNPDDNNSRVTIVYVPPKNGIPGKDICIACAGCREVFKIGSVNTHKCKHEISTSKARSKCWIKRGAATVKIVKKNEASLVTLTSQQSDTAEVLFLPPKKKEQEYPYEFGCLLCHTINTVSTIGKHVCSEGKKNVKGPVSCRTKSLVLNRRQLV